MKIRLEVMAIDWTPIALTPTAIISLREEVPASIIAIQSQERRPFYMPYLLLLFLKSLTQEGFGKRSNAIVQTRICSDTVEVDHKSWTV